MERASGAADLDGKVIQKVNTILMLQNILLSLIETSITQV